MVQLTEDLVRELDEEAARQRTSRSELIRRAVSAFLVEARRDLIGEQIAEGYRRIPQGTPDDWGDLSEHADRSAREMMQRLDAEERDAGFEPW